MLNANTERWLDGALIDKFGLHCKFPFAITDPQCMQCTAVKGLMNQCKSKGCVPEGTTHNAMSCLNTTAFCWLCREFVRSQQDLDLLICLTELRTAPFEAWGQSAAAQDAKVAVTELLSSLPRKAFICPGDLNKMKCWSDTESDLCPFEKSKLRFKSHTSQRCGT